MCSLCGATACRLGKGSGVTVAKLLRWLVWTGALLSIATARPAAVCDITAHGAAVGSKDNAKAIQAAVAACAGGTVAVPEGSFKTGPLVVSGEGVTLSLTGDLVAAFGPDDWPLVKGSGERGLEGGDAASPQYQDFLTFTGCTQCGLVGNGTLYGKGGRPPAGNDWYYLFDQGKIKPKRPVFVRVEHSTDFVMSGITVLVSTDLILIVIPTRTRPTCHPPTTVLGLPARASVPVGMRVDALSGSVRSCNGRMHM